MAYIHTHVTKASSRLPAIARLISILEIWHQRRALKQLSDDQLLDIGVTREEARSEASRPIWDVPHHWR